MFDKFLLMDGILIKIVDVIFRMLYVCVHYICALINGFQGKKVPPVKNSILLLSGTELAKRIRQRTLSSYDVVQAYIDRINEVDTYINAIVDRRFEDALEEAKEADSLVASGKMTEEQLKNLKPLLGVPFTVKQIITVKGLQCTAGSVLFKDLQAEKDGVTVALMKDAGAIVLASTNTPECGMNLQTYNHLHGITVNPYDTSRTSGGSTGGESAIIGAAGSVIGLGNDLAGSLRVPSFFTGIFCHKPSTGLVSNEGCFPPPNPEVQPLLNTGPLCRYAEDLVTTMRILSVPDEISNKFGNEVDFHKLKVYYLYSFGENVPLMINVDPEIKDAVRRVVSHFKKKGSKVEEVTIPLFKYSTFMLLHALLSSVPDIRKTLTCGKADINPLQELIKFLCFQSRFTMIYLIVLNSQSTFFYNLNIIEYYKKLINKLDDQLYELLDENSVLVMPTLPRPAPYNNEVLTLVGSYGYPGVFNVLGLPVTQCPVGLNTEGLPVGIQIVSRRRNDPLTISCALEVEKAFGGWTTP